ncbi:Uncharacterised protein [Mycobacteroides abscessus subsp. abscessus]|nr:Uncharacterised protein [Mycobacteroides abscessus subsp. abscessus]SKW81539.1 Uncharacterised protein [Mycobacteroides abscessus subsp. abscessus]
MYTRQIRPLALAFFSPAYWSYRLRVNPTPRTQSPSALNGPLPMGCTPNLTGSRKNALGRGRNAVYPKVIG